MIEFGSDFHYVEERGGGKNTLQDFFPSANYYADGRQALIHLYRSQGWQRLWVPEYFCYDVVASLREAGLELRFYTDYPGSNDNENLNLDFRAGDAVLRVNYFGTRSYRSPEKLMVPVVEDHTHDLIGDWALRSTADWCIASLRKSLPIPEGGMLWSPVGSRLPEQPALSDENERIAAIRWEAMKLKADYLEGRFADKDAFRKKFTETEEWFDDAEPVAIDKRSMEYLSRFDVTQWQQAKRRNWLLLKDSVHADFQEPENDDATPFSLILMAKNGEERERIRQQLIKNAVYPAILWHVPDDCCQEVKDVSRRMISIHCDGRYTEDDMKRMATIINEAI